MKKFISQVSLFLIVAFACFLGILSNADGWTDGYYMRFTTPQQDCLILGTSRAAQGIQPEVFKDICGKSFLNYAFTVSDSPYGPVYLNSIKKKVNPNCKNGIFVLAVDPWSISSTGKDPDDPMLFSENNSFLNNTKFVNVKPNFNYLLWNLSGEYHVVLTRKSGNVFLHDDGWLEVNVKMDSISVKKRSNSKIAHYRNDNLPSFKYSNTRIDYLNKTIEFLSDHGKVFLVRLPVHPEMMEIEQELMPYFDAVIRDSLSSNEGYFDMTSMNNKFDYTDGNHLYKTSANLVSAKIANWINSRK